MTLPGGDSATPKPAQYFRRKVWGVYVAGATFRVWTHPEVLELRRYGVEGVMPIVVPSQTEPWWEFNSGYTELEALVRAARDWGVPKGAPLCLDVEQHQADQMMAKTDVAHAWAVATRAHGYRTWTYSGRDYLLSDPYGFKWLADWDENPAIPQGFNAHQYATRAGTLGIDLDTFEAGRDYMTPDRGVVILREPSIKSHSEPGASSIQPATDSTVSATGAGPAGSGPTTAPAGDLATEHL